MYYIENSTDKLFIIKLFASIQCVKVKGNKFGKTPKIATLKNFKILLFDF